MQDELSVAAAKAAPPVAYLGATFAGLSLPDWAAVLAIIYTLGLLLQMGWKFSLWIRRQVRVRAIKRESTEYGDGGL